MSTEAVTPAPVGESGRLQCIDIIKGVALFGILLLNITLFGLPLSYEDPTVYGGTTGANLWAWITMSLFFEGTQRGIFSILFGAGFIILTSRFEAAGRSDTADIYYRRTLWLILLGLIHSYLLLWTGEILYYYGVTALFLFPLRKMAPRALMMMAGVGLLIAAIWNAADSHGALQHRDKGVAAEAVLSDGGELSEEQQANVDAWKKLREERKPTEKTIARDIEAHKGSYLDVLVHQAPINAHFESWWLYRYFFDIFSMMLIGMALFKLGVLQNERPVSLYWMLVLVGYGVGLAVNYHEVRTIVDGEFAVVAFLKSFITYDLGRLAMTMGHLGLLLLFCRSGWLDWLQRSLAAVGRMALTSYVSHSIICAFVFYGFGFGLYGELERYQLYYVVVSIWIFQLIVSPLWLARFRFGPLEWIWRSLTYMKRQPMRRSAPIAEAV